jgi:hypothetical protein
VIDSNGNPSDLRFRRSEGFFVFDPGGILLEYDAGFSVVADGFGALVYAGQRY